MHTKLLRTRAHTFNMNGRRFFFYSSVHVIAQSHARTFVWSETKMVLWLDWQRAFVLHWVCVCVLYMLHTWLSMDFFFWHTHHACASVRRPSWNTRIQTAIQTHKQDAYIDSCDFHLTWREKLYLVKRLCVCGHVLHMVRYLSWFTLYIQSKHWRLLDGRDSHLTVFLKIFFKYKNTLRWMNLIWSRYIISIIMWSIFFSDCRLLLWFYKIFRHQIRASAMTFRWWRPLSRETNSKLKNKNSFNVSGDLINNNTIAAQYSLSCTYFLRFLLFCSTLFSIITPDYYL